MAEFPIFVKIRNKNKAFFVTSNTRVRDLKCKIHEQEGIPIEQQRLFIAHMAKYLENGITMRDYNIRKHTQLKVQLPMRSTSRPSQTTSSSTSGSGSIPKFPSHMSLEDAYQLKVNDKIDHRDEVGRFVYATVSQKQGTNLMIHYDGWSKEWDTWSDFQKEIHRFAKAGSISRRPAHRFKELKKGDYIDINPEYGIHTGWKCAEIQRFDQNSGQVQVVYVYGYRDCLYWAHLDNEHEIAEFASRHKCALSIHAVDQRQALPEEHEKNSDQNILNKQIQRDGQQQEVMDESIRSFRFPRHPNERIDNPYRIGDSLEVQDPDDNEWYIATIIDKENNWIVVHFDGWSSTYARSFNVIQYKHGLRERQIMPKGVAGPSSYEKKDNGQHHDQSQITDINEPNINQQTETQPTFEATSGSLHIELTWNEMVSIKKHLEQVINPQLVNINAEMVKYQEIPQLLQIKQHRSTYNQLQQSASSFNKQAQQYQLQYQELEEKIKSIKNKEMNDILNACDEKERELRAQFKRYSLQKKYAKTNSDFKFFVAIDFGTDGAGLAYYDGEEVYIHDKFGSIKYSSTIKPKTIILLDKQGKCETFGMDAKITLILYI